MAHIKLKIEVSNSQEVIKKQKGKWIALASRFLSPTTRKQRVEAEVYKGVMEELQAILPEKLAEKGIVANVTIGIEN